MAARPALSRLVAPCRRCRHRTPPTTIQRSAVKASIDSWLTLLTLVDHVAAADAPDQLHRLAARGRED